MIHYIVDSKKYPGKMKIIIGGETRALEIQAHERYNSGDKWNSKYGGSRDYKIVRMKITKYK